MNVEYSKGFQKEFRKQSGKIREAILQVIQEVKQAKTLDDITDCRKVLGLKNIYRIRTGNLRAFFSFHVMVEEDKVYFIALLSRGQAYDKKSMQTLKKAEAE
jgi:mRNA-degrading endonuclease RelE of RelBE toxin-antitoxin system